AIITRDVWCFGAAKLFCWRKRRQTQRRAQAELLQLRKESDERAARLLQATQRLQQRASAPRYGDRLPQYPFVIECDNNHQFELAMREITSMLRAQDKRRFLASVLSGEDN
ncbi:MAG TPA: hypothetical protein VHA06_24045, partial [Candidatus Angelobacter sp.]|nr:hypothetical protein [Candidatus Angelobacter sp.]